MFSVKPSPAPLPRSLAGAGAGIERRLVDRHIEHLGARVEEVVGAVAVVNVPVEDQDPLERVLRDRVDRGDGDVVEDAEAAGARTQRMMARRTAGGEGCDRIAGDEDVDHRDGPADRPQSGLPRSMADQRVVVDLAAAGRAEPLERRHIARVVAGLEQLAVDAGRVAALEAEPTGVIEVAFDRDDPLATLGMRSCVVLGGGRVAEEDAGRHRCTVPANV